MLRQLLKVPHFWAILAIMACGTTLYYADQIPVLRDVMAQAPFTLARYSTYRLLSIIPVAYAAFVFRFRGGAIVAVVVSLGLLPRAVFISSQRPEAIAETFAFFFMGLLVSWLIDRQQRALNRLENARQALLDSLQTVRDQRQLLQLSEERYRGLFENAGEAILICSTNGRIITANRSCERLTEYSHDELADTSIYGFFSEDDAETVRGIFTEGVRGRTVGETEELCLIRKDGTQAFVRLSVGRLPGEEQTPIVQVIALDITEETQLRKSMEYYIRQITRAQEDERLRISRELHDDTAQVLAGLSRDIASFTTSHEEELLQPMAEQLTKLRDTADTVLEGVRRFSQNLRPSILDDLGLIPALEWLATDLEKQPGITAGISVSGESRRLPPEEELVVFRVAQEALSNARRHSGASRIDITVDIGDEALTIIISDNGNGFEMPQRASDLVPSGKLGIVGMRERARLVGATLIVQSEIGKGTTVTLRVPE